VNHRRTSIQAFKNSSKLRHNQTEAEAKLWQVLRAHQLSDIHFRRQHAIGPYIVDFCSPRHKLIIELDGSQHLEQQEYDTKRTAYLEAKGYRVLRFWNNEVAGNLDGVLQKIMDNIR
jgi:very-short-patch-repair endonuclease